MAARCCLIVCGEAWVLLDVGRDVHRRDQPNVVNVILGPRHNPRGRCYSRTVLEPISREVTIEHVNNSHQEVGIATEEL